MPRYPKRKIWYLKRKTCIGASSNVLIDASVEVKSGKSITSLTKSFGICHETFNRYVQKLQEFEEKKLLKLPRVSYWSPNIIFFLMQEVYVIKYFLNSADHFMDLPPEDKFWQNFN